MAGPGKPVGTPKTGGRVRGKSIDREARKLLTDKMAGDLIWAYDKAGGRELLLKIAQEQPLAFLQHGLSRLLPQPIKEDADGATFNTQINVGSDLDAARRISYLLSKAAHDLENPTELIGEYAYTPAPAYDRDCDPQAACHVEPEPRPDLIGDAAREAWAESLALTPEEQLCRETQTASIENYRGGAGEGRVDMPRRTEAKRRR